MISTLDQLRDQGLLMLEGSGAILETARAVSRVLSESNIAGGVIGGVAVALHGRVRATTDVDVFVPEPLADFARSLTAAGFSFDSVKREFILGGVPVHLVSASQALPVPTHFETRDDIRVVSLADLINLKLRSGTRSLLRSRDLADVIDLIDFHRLDGRYAGQIAKPLRDEFRRLTRLVRAHRERPAPLDPFENPG